MLKSTAAVVDSEDVGGVSFHPEVRNTLHTIAGGLYRLSDEVHAAGDVGSLPLRDALDEMGLHAEQLANLPYWAEELRAQGFTVGLDSSVDCESVTTSLADLLDHDGRVAIDDAVLDALRGIRDALHAVSDDVTEHGGEGHGLLSAALEEQATNTNRLLTLQTRVPRTSPTARNAPAARA